MDHLSGLRFQPVILQGNLSNDPDLGIEPGSPTLWADSLPSKPPGKPQEYWNGLPFPSLEDLPDPGIEPRYPVLQADSLPTEPAGKPPAISHTPGKF